MPCLMRISQVQTVPLPYLAYHVYVCFFSSLCGKVSRGTATFNPYLIHTTSRAAKRILPGCLKSNLWNSDSNSSSRIRWMGGMRWPINDQALAPGQMTERKLTSLSVLSKCLSVQLPNEWSDYDDMVPQVASSTGVARSQGHVPTFQSDSLNQWQSHIDQGREYSPCNSVGGGALTLGVVVNIFEGKISAGMYVMYRGQPYLE